MTIGNIDFLSMQPSRWTGWVSFEDSGSSSTIKSDPYNSTTQRPNSLQKSSLVMTEVLIQGLLLHLQTRISSLLMW